MIIIPGLPYGQHAQGVDNSIGWTALCTLCGEEITLTPEEVFTNLPDLAKKRYVCPLCRRLLDEAADDNGQKPDFPAPYFPQQTHAAPLDKPKMMEVHRYDCHEEKSGSDDTTDDERKKHGSMYSSSDEGSDAEKSCHGEFSCEATLSLRLFVRLNAYPDYRHR